MADPRELTPAELVARGLLPAGPLAPALKTKDPEQNLQTMRDFVNPRRIIPDPEIINPVNVLGKLHQAAGTGLGHVMGALGGLNLGSGLMSPDQKALRSRQLGNQVRDMGEGLLMPVASVGRVMGPVAQRIGPLFTAFLTRLGQSAGLAGFQKGMEGRDAGTVFGSAAFAAALQGALEGPGTLVRTLLSSKAGAAILADAAAQFQKSLQSFQARQQFNSEFVAQLNETRAQGFKEEAARASAEYGLKAYNHKIEGQKMIADWEQAVQAQNAAKELARSAHSEQVANNITTTWNTRVPSWAGLSGDVRGLVDRVYGQGQALLQQGFQTSLNEIIQKSRGVMVRIPAETATALGIEGARSGARGSSGVPLPGTPGSAFPTASGRGGPPGLIEDGSGTVQVDAGDVARRLYGHKGELDPDIYHSAVQPMIDAGLGNGKANAEYSAGTALRQFMDKTQALEYIGQPKLDVEKLLKGLTKLPILKQLQGRIPEEDALQGAIAGARDHMPTAPPDIPKPVQGPLAPAPPKGVPPLPTKTDPDLAPSQAPQEPLPEDLGVRVGEGPTAQKLATVGGLLGAGVGGQVGGGYGHYGLGGAGGTILGLLLSKLMSGPTVRGPISSRAENLLADIPTKATGAIRGFFSDGHLSPEQIAEMDAEIRATKAAETTPDPRLSITLQENDPVENR